MAQTRASQPGKGYKYNLYRFRYTQFCKKKRKNKTNGRLMRKRMYVCIVIILCDGKRSSGSPVGRTAVKSLARSGIFFGKWYYIILYYGHFCFKFLGIFQIITPKIRCARLRNIAFGANPSPYISPCKNATGSTGVQPLFSASDASRKP